MKYTLTLFASLLIAPFSALRPSGLAGWVCAVVGVLSVGAMEIAGAEEAREKGILHGVFGDAVAMKVPPAGWSFAWNAAGGLEGSPGFTALDCVETASGRRTSVAWGVSGRGGELTADRPSFSDAGDAFGIRDGDGTPRSAIASFTLSTEPGGEIWINHGNLRNKSFQGGTSLDILINGKRMVGRVAPQDRTPLLFQENLGKLKKGDVIQVAVGPGERAPKGGGRLRFVIEEYPPASKPGPPVNILCPPLDASEPQRDAKGGYAAYLAKHEAQCDAVVKEQPELVFIGDSITARWPQELLQKHFGRLRPVNLGVGGDWIQNVRWRIENGVLGKAPVKAAVLLIGTNNLTAGFSPVEIAQGIRDLAGLLRARAPGCQILVLGILPRGDLLKDPLNDKVRKVNGLLASFQDGKNIHFLDVGSSLVEPDGRLDPSVFPDKLHVALPGFVRMLVPLQPKLESLPNLKPTTLQK